MHENQYPASMRTLHWLVAILVLAILAVGFLMTGWLSETPYTGTLYNLHKSFGMLVLMLMVLRMSVRWRFKAIIPVLPATIPWYERLAANWGHRFLYLCLVLMPLSGYALSSSHPKSKGILFFGIPVPALIPKSESLAAIFKDIHIATAYFLLGLIVLHILGAIRHRYFDKPEHDRLKTMWS